MIRAIFRSENPQLYELSLINILGFAKIKCTKSKCEDILKETELNVLDRLAFACVYLHDRQLPDFINSISCELYHKKSLMGLVVTGFSAGHSADKFMSGMSHLENYMRVDPGKGRFW